MDFREGGTFDSTFKGRFKQANISGANKTGPSDLELVDPSQLYNKQRYQGEARHNSLANNTLVPLSQSPTNTNAQNSRHNYMVTGTSSPM